MSTTTGRLAGKRCIVTDISLFGGNATAATGALRQTPSPLSTGATLVIIGPLPTSSSLPAAISYSSLAAHTLYVGPCRLRMTVGPGNNTAQVTYGSFGFYDATGQ